MTSLTQAPFAAAADRTPLTAGSAGGPASPSAAPAGGSAASAGGPAAPPADGDWITTRVTRRIDEAEDIVSLLLEAADGTPLPAYDAGSHVEVDLGDGMVRHYSLCTPPGEGRYRLGVLRDPQTRGGSHRVHADLREGATLRIRPPRNLFPLAADGPSLLLAGGIGITPILAMAYALAGAGRPFALHYTTRSLNRAAFLPEIAAAFGPRAQVHADDGAGAPRLDLKALLQGSDRAAHVYCCGPAGFIDAVLAEARSLGWPEQRLHVERFTAGEVDTTGTFRVVAQKSGIEVAVAEGQTILEALLDAGLDVPFSCEAGVCGTCICDVIEGVPDHQDAYQTDEEKAQNDRIAICCSRALTPRLVLDV